MHEADPSAAACLQVLLEDQTARLHTLLRTLEGAVRSGLHVVPSTQWAGPARDAHDDLVQRMTARLDAARITLDRAAAESARAAATLASRV